MLIEVWLLLHNLDFIPWNVCLWPILLVLIGAHREVDAAERLLAPPPPDPAPEG